MSRNGRRIAAAVLVALSVFFVVGGVIYLTTPAADLPGFLPGKPEFKEKAVQRRTKTFENQGRVVKDGKVYEKDGTTVALCKVGTTAVPAKGDKTETCLLYHDRKLTKRGVLMFVLAAGCLIGAYYVSGVRTSTSKPTAEQ